VDPNAWAGKVTIVSSTWARRLRDSLAIPFIHSLSLESIVHIRTWSRLPFVFWPFPCDEGVASKGTPTLGWQVSDRLAKVAYASLEMIGNRCAVPSRTATKVGLRGYNGALALACFDVEGFWTFHCWKRFARGVALFNLYVSSLPESWRRSAVRESSR